MPYGWPKAAGVLFAAALLNGSAQAVGVLNGSVADGAFAVAAVPVGDGGSPYNAFTKPQVKSQKPVGSGSKTLGTAAAPSTQAGRVSRPPPRPPSLGSYQPPPPSGFQAPNLGGYQPPPPTGFQPPNLGGYQPPPPTGLQPPSLGGFQPPSWPRDQHSLPAPAASGTATPGTVAGPPPPSVAGGTASTCYGPTASPSGCSVQSPSISGTPATNVMIGGPQSNGELPHPAPPPQGSPPLPPGTDVCRVRPDLCLAPAPRSNVAGGNANVGGATGSAPAGGGGQATVVVREEYGSPGPAIGVVIGVPTVEYVPQPVPVYPDPPPGAYSENQVIYGQPPPATAAAAPAAPAVVDPFVEVIARLKRLDEMRRNKLITADDHRGQRQAILAALDAGQVSRTVGIEYGLRRLKGMSDDGTIDAKEYEEKRKEFVLLL
ncbi:MAG: hypothetical protein L6R19_15735 [Alphaproteobacteria bacterium]|nr:hypothetical protein [Alphaproteobacteria bacterium]